MNMILTLKSLYQSDIFHLRLIKLMTIFYCSFCIFGDIHLYTCVLQTLVSLKNGSHCCKDHFRTKTSFCPKCRLDLLVSSPWLIVTQMNMSFNLSTLLFCSILPHKVKTQYLQYTTRETGQKMWVPRVSPSKTAGQIFHSQLSASQNLRDILSSVDGPWFQKHRNTRPAVYYRVTREMLCVRHFPQDLPQVTLARHCPFSRVVYCTL